MVKALGAAVLARSFLPSCAVLELTYRCNQACVFCSCPWLAPSAGFRVMPEMDIPSWKQVIAQFCELGVREFALTGGEPLLKDGLIELLDYASSCRVSFAETEYGELVEREQPPRLYLLSNGRQMTDEIIEACRRNSVGLSLSLPGLDSFEWHTGGAHPTKVLDWFRATKLAGIPSTVGITVTRRNLQELAQTMTEALCAGADKVLLNRFMPGGRGLTARDELDLSPADLEVMLDTAEAVLSASKRNGHVGTELPRCAIVPEKYVHLQVGTTCGAAIGFFVVGPSGYVRVCNHSPIRLAHASRIFDVRDDPYWRRFVHKQFRPAECADCNAALDGTCDGGCRELAHVTAGSVDAPDPLACPERVHNGGRRR